MKLRQKNILIVGASQGIGKGLALELAKGQNNIAVVSRRLAVLETVVQEIEDRGGQGLAIEADALDPDRAEAVVSEVVSAFGAIDLAILVVGGAPPAFTHQAKVRTHTKIMELNYHSMVNYFRPVVEQMKEQGGGLIAHLNSLAGLVVMPSLGPYSAAKAACRVFLDTARAELLEHNVRISVLCPGFINTPGLQGVDPSPFPVMEADYAARKMVKALEREQRLYKFPATIVAAIKTANNLPYFLVKKIHKKALQMSQKATIKSTSDD